MKATTSWPDKNSSCWGPFVCGTAGEVGLHGMTGAPERSCSADSSNQCGFPDGRCPLYRASPDSSRKQPNPGNVCAGAETKVQISSRRNERYEHPSSWNDGGQATRQSLLFGARRRSVTSLDGWVDLSASYLCNLLPQLWEGVLCSESGGEAHRNRGLVCQYVRAFLAEAWTSWVPCSSRCYDRMLTLVRWACQSSWQVCVC
jgi:hypothetical protein